MGLFCLSLLPGCNSDPEEARQRLLETGNRYFEGGQHKEAALIYRRAIQKDRRFGEAYYKLGLAQIELGRVNGAFRSLSRAVELQPDNTDAFAKLADIYISAAAASPRHKEKLMGDLADLADRAERSDIDPYHILRIRGYVALADGNDEEAIEYLTEAWGMNATDENIPAAIVSALVSLQRLSEAEKTALEAIESHPATEKLYELLYLLYSQQNRPADAEGLIRQKVENNPDAVAGRLQLAAHFHRFNQPRMRDQTLQEMIADPDRFPSAYEKVGDFYLGMEDPDSAIRLFRQAAERDPAQNARFLSKAALALSVKGSYAEALDLIEEVLDDDPDYELAQMLRGSLRIYSTDPEVVRDSVQELEELLPRMPENAVLRFSLGRAYLAIGDQEKALVQFQESARLREDFVPSRLALGHVYLRQGQAAMAQQQAEQILETRPRHLQANMLMAGALIVLKKYENARAGITRLLEEYPGNRDLQYLMASLEFEERQYGNAERILRKLRSSSPADPRISSGLVSLYMAQGKHDLALTVLDEEIAQGTESPSLLAAKARVSMLARNYDQAISEFERAIELEPGSARLHVETGTAHYGAKRPAEAEKYYRKAWELDPKLLEATLRLSMLLGEQGKRAESRELLDDVLKRAPDNPVALNNLAYMMSDSPESLDTALSLAQRANNRAPQTPKIMDTLGWIYLKKNLSDDAVRVYGELVGLDPGISTWRYHHAMALYQKGALNEARKEAEEALRHKPGKTEEAQIQDLLTRIG